MEMLFLSLLGVMAWALGSFAASRTIMTRTGWRIAPMFSAFVTHIFIMVGVVAPWIVPDCFGFGEDCAWTRYQLFGSGYAWLLHLVITLVSLFLKRWARIRLPLVGLLVATSAGVIGMVLFHAILWNP
jgi:hypothetical protein